MFSSDHFPAFESLHLLPFDSYCTKRKGNVYHPQGTLTSLLPCPQLLWILLGVLCRGQGFGYLGSHEGEGSFFLLKTAVEIKIKLGNDLPIHVESPVPCWQGYSVKQSCFLLIQSFSELIKWN